ncbi:Microtubule-associated protein, microtubule dynamics during spindle orientation [Globomyces sp. JEL0801]|nr:Microtubule-associated protein, microtubule dynamics during spindle orientation [Globomyces sp. JEL0801]
MLCIVAFQLFPTMSDGVSSDEEDDKIFAFDHDEFPPKEQSSVTSLTNDYIPDINRLTETDQVLAIEDFVASDIKQIKNTVSLEDFAVLSVIGKGAYGQVFLVQKKVSNEYYAMKVLKKATIVLHTKDTEHTKNERSVLEEIRHPFIVKLYFAFQTPSRLYLILNYASGGELFTYLTKERMFSEDVARFYISELLLALQHLHSIGIIYRDLKPENVMLGTRSCFLTLPDGEGHLMLTDFGLSKVAINAQTVCGTVEFMLYDMLTGGNRKKIMEGVLKKKPNYPKYMTSQARDLCTKVFQLFDLYKLLKKDPQHRLGSGPNGAEEIKKHAFFKKTNWTKLFNREITPPYVPDIVRKEFKLIWKKCPEDTSNFSAEFTNMSIEGSFAPHDVPLGDHADLFRGFSFVAMSRTSNMDANQAEEDFSTIPLEDRIVHKSWKARQSAYDQGLKLIKLEENHLVLAPFLKGAVSDQNQIAQELGVQMVLEYITLTADAQSKSKVVPIAIEKCFGSSRANTKSRAIELLLIFVEIDNPEYVVESLLNSLDHKTPKIVSTCVNCLTEIVKQFGIPTVSIKPIMKILPKLFDHRDKNVRLEGTALVMEIYRWIGAALMNSLNELKPVQLKELSTQFENLPKETPKRQRYLRSETPPTAANDENIDDENQEIVEDTPDVPDAFDFADPVNFIDKLPKSFYTDLASSKWKERKEALESLIQLVSFPKLEDGKYFELINVLAKKMQDPNIPVVVLVATSIEKLALGLKLSFSQYKSIIITPLLERFKEKKTNVIEAIRSALAAIFNSILVIKDIFEDVMTFMAHPHPQVKTETLQWFLRCLSLKKCKTELSKPELKQLTEKLLKAIEDSTPDVRDAAANVLGAMHFYYSEKAMSVYLEKLDKTKSQKVLDYFEFIKSNTKGAAKSTQKAAPDPPKSVATLKQSSSMSMSKSSSSILKSASGTPKSRSLSNISSKAPAKSSVKSGMSSKSNSQASLPVEESIKYLYSDDSALEYMAGLFPEDVLGNLSSSAWKSRLEEGLVDKLGDNKIKKVASNCLDEIATRTSVEFVFSNAYDAIKTQKSPKIIGDSLLWMNQTLKDFGTNGLNIKEFIKFIKENLTSSAAAVRSNSISLLVTCRQFAGPDIRALLNDVNPSVLSTIDVEMEKVVGLSPPAPTKMPVIPANDSTKIEDLIPQVDLLSKLPADIIDRMNNSQWKERKAALEEINQVIVASNHRLLPNIDPEFIASVKARLTDGNKNIVCLAVELCGKLAKSTGKSFERFCRGFIGPVLSQLSDQKVSVRTTVIVSLDQFVEASGVGLVLSNIVSSLLGEQPQIRKDLLKWLIDNNDLLSHDSVDGASLIHPILACLQDKNADVRKLAQTTFTNLAEIVSPNIIRKKANDLYKGAQLTTLGPYLDSIGSSQETPSVRSSASSLQSRVNSSTVSKQSNSNSSSRQNSGSNILAKSRTSSTKINRTKKEAEPIEDSLTAALLSDDPKLKESRMNSDRGILKWSFESPRKDLIEALRDQCSGNFSSELHNLLFSEDHYKEKEFLKGLSLLDSFFTDKKYDQDLLLSRTVANCDLILKYLTIRFFDTNTSILIKCLDTLDHLLDILGTPGYLLNDYEAGSFLPFFIGKLGDPKESMRTKLRGILKKLGYVYPVSKLFNFLIRGLDSKNSKTRMECLEEVASLIQRNGLNVFTPAKAIPLIAVHVGDRDAPVRNAALNALCQAYLVIGDDLHKHLIKLSDKDKDIIAERIRRVASSQAPIVGGIKKKASVSRPTTPASNIPTSVLSPSRKQKPATPKPEFSENPSNEVAPSKVRKQFSLDLDKLNLLDSRSASASNLQAAQGSSSISLASIVTETRTENVDDRLDVRLDIAMEQLAGASKDIALEASRHIEKLLGAHPNHEVIRSRDMVGIIIPIMNNTFTNLTANDVPTNRLCKHLTSILIQIFSSKESTNYVPYESLENAVRTILLRLVDPTLALADVSKNLSRALNMLMVRVIENCEPNTTFRVLLQLLREGSLNDDSFFMSSTAIQNKFTELVMKCLWKITKLIPNFLNNDQLQVDSLLVDIHIFLEAAPPHYWKQKSANNHNLHSDMPLRTVKTIMHELVNVLQDNVLESAITLPNQSSNYTINYLRQMILSVHKKKGGPTTVQNITSTVSKSSPDDKQLEFMLDQIFNQIADKKETKLGIQRLYDIQKQYPHILPMVEEKVAKTGSYFQGYIRRSLANLSQEEVMNSFDYNQTLQRLQKQFQSREVSNSSLETDNPLNGHTSPSVIDTSYANEPKENIEMPENEQKVGEGRSLAIEELKERLARMKLAMGKSTQQ